MVPREREASETCALRLTFVFCCGVQGTERKVIPYRSQDFLKGEGGGVASLKKLTFSYIMSGGKRNAIFS